MTSKIIFLNGCSSAGKTSLVKAIQHLSNEPWLTLGIDSFFATMPAKYLPFGKKAEEGIQFIPGTDEERFPIMQIKSGLFGKKVFNLIPKVVKQLADDDINIIIDEVVWERQVMENYVSILKNHQIYFFNIFCDLFSLEERELLRRDRSLGLARDQFTKINKLNWEYDMKINTGQISPLVNAKKILEFVKNFESKSF